MDAKVFRFVDIGSEERVVYTGTIAHATGCQMLGGDVIKLEEDTPTPGEGEEKWAEAPAPSWWASIAQSKMLGNAIPKASC